MATVLPESRNRLCVLGVEVDPLTLQGAADRVQTWLTELVVGSRGARVDEHAGKYVVTPNLDHAVQLTSNAALRRAYGGASLVVADGAPLVLASRLSGNRLPERVAGSDLTPLVLKCAPSGCRVFLLGGSEETSKRATETIAKDYPQVTVAGRLSPPLGFHLDEAWNERIVREIRQSGAQLILIGLGAPKQELWIAEHHVRLPGTVSMCVGATLDFIAGTVKRAPLWAQRGGVEWVHRVLSDPRRLTKRYAKDALYFPYLLAADLGLAPKRRTRVVPETSGR